MNFIFGDAEKVIVELTKVCYYLLCHRSHVTSLHSLVNKHLTTWQSVT